MTRGEAAFMCFTLACVLTFFLCLGVMVWAEEQTKRECIRAGMSWEDGDCVPRGAR